MKLVGRGEECGGVDGLSRTLVVGVKLDQPSKELLTWALVKLAHPGDHVVALHVLDPDGMSVHPFDISVFVCLLFLCFCVCVCVCLCFFFCFMNESRKLGSLLGFLV